MSCHLYFIHTQRHTARCKYGMPSSYNANKSTTSLYRVILWELGARICRVRCRRWEHETLKSKSFTNGIRQLCTRITGLQRLDLRSAHRGPKAKGNSPSAICLAIAAQEAQPLPWGTSMGGRS